MFEASVIEASAWVKKKKSFSPEPIYNYTYTWAY